MKKLTPAEHQKLIEQTLANGAGLLIGVGDSLQQFIELVEANRPLLKEQGETELIKSLVESLAIIENQLTPVYAELGAVLENARTNALSKAGSSNQLALETETVLTIATYSRHLNHLISLANKNG